MSRIPVQYACLLALCLTPGPLFSCSGSERDDAPTMITVEERSTPDDPGRDTTPDGATADAPPAPPSADLIARGETAFNEGFCVKCHQAGGTGSDRAPNLTDDIWVQCDGSIDGIASLIRSGVPKDNLSNPDLPFAMNSAAKMKLSDEAVEALAAYVWSLSR